MSKQTQLEYSLIGPNSKRAAEQGLVAAEWYHAEVPRKRMKELMRRKDGPALRDTALWFFLLIAFGVGGFVFWGSWACVPFFICYGVMYGSASDSRWHESGHGTAFKTPWMNDVLYQIASFMNMKEPTLWRWSHARHHTDTLIVGRDKEILVMRPPDVARLVTTLLPIEAVFRVMSSVVRHAAGRLTPDELTFLPESERSKVFWEARAWLAIYAAVIAASIVLGTILPLMYVGLPFVYGIWFGYIFGLTQHAGLAENVLDHRLNSRTVETNRVFRFIIWNMNFHVEHHMFPMVPYHALPALHEEIKDDLPKPCSGLIDAYREILPTLWRQLREPGYHLERDLPQGASSFRPDLHEAVFRGGSA